MAVAAYASVLSLLRVIDNIRHPSRLRVFPDTTQLDALREKLCSLQDFLEVHSSTISKDIECTARRIPEVTYFVESLIDKYVVDQLYRKLYAQDDNYNAEILFNNYVMDQLYKESDDLQNDVVGWNFHNELHRVIQEIETINEALTTLRTIQHNQEQPRFSVPSLAIASKKKTVVGFEDQLNQVLTKLVGNEQNLVIVPVVGMGGIGKTTLARSVFDHPYNLHHFSMRIWLTISQDYSVKKVLQGLLKDGVLDDKKDRELGDISESELIVELHKKLFGQRYLIVLDDVWNEKAWHELKHGFPDNGKGSRVLVTTRLSTIASSLGSRNNNTYSMKFLDKEKSWELLSKKAFENGGWSHELEEIGREISVRCKGLPLLLVVIGGLLENSNMTVEYWQTVAQDINSIANSAYDEYCLRTLSLSYHHLTLHLKPCFLYMRHFEEDSDIGVSELIETWVSQGFVKPMRGRSLEEAARKYLEDLVSRNMLLIRQRGCDGNIEICGIHDLLRDLCFKESQKEQLLDVPRILVVANEFDEACHFCKELRTKGMLLSSEIFGSESTASGRVVACSSCRHSQLIGRSRSVVVVKTDSQKIPVMTKYRRLSIIGDYSQSVVVLPAICLLWNLESLDRKTLPYRLVMPKEIWEMPQLRRVVSTGGFMLPDPTLNDVIVLENLHTLYTIKQFKCTEEIVRRIPNLIKLGVVYGLYEEEEDSPCICLQSLASLQKLESLSLRCYNNMVSMKDIAFPCSLKKLTLEGCRITSWDDLTIIIGSSSLPNLQVLNLLPSSVLGEEWNPIEGELLFPRLKYLELRESHLVQWRVDHETQFPALETLVLAGMDALREIPREIGELPSLNSITLHWCSVNIIDSARVIVDEQINYGNERLVVHVEELRRTYQIGATY